MSNLTKENNCEVLALVPARGGSKSMPRKNLRVVGGKPMVVHAIEHALNSKTITRVILTTDDDEIAEVGANAGAEVPFMRPAEFAEDLSTDYEFVRHALTWLRDNEQYVPDLVVQLRPTTPIRDTNIIDRGVELLSSKPEADSLRAVVKACYSPYKMWSHDENGYLKAVLQHPKYDEAYNEPRQNLPTIYQHDGFLDITRPSTIFEKNSVTGRNILPLFLDEISIDIDYEHELVEANKIMEGE